MYFFPIPHYQPGLPTCPLFFPATCNSAFLDLSPRHVDFTLISHLLIIKTHIQFTLQT